MHGLKKATPGVNGCIGLLLIKISLIKITSVKVASWQRMFCGHL